MTRASFQQSGFFDRLTDTGSPSKDERTVVLEHLFCLLNTRRGDALATAGYGLPDIASLSGAFPAAAQWLRRDILHAISHYEPRLQEVTVTTVHSDSPTEVEFQIEGTLRDVPGRRVSFQIQVRHSGHVDIC
jgi:type VI secretion system protein